MTTYGRRDRMFKKLFKKQAVSEEIVSPASGKSMKIEDVPDPIFSQKMMGEGIAVLPSDGKIVAPVSGEIIQLAETKHAFGIKTDLGAEILVHIGLETVALKGQGFNPVVKVGDHVSKGQLIIEVDLDFIREHAASTIIPMVITNSSENLFTFTWEPLKEVTSGESEVMTLQLK